MRPLLEGRRTTFASIGLLFALGLVALSASCGKNTNGGYGDDSTGTSSGGNDNGGDDATTGCGGGGFCADNGTDASFNSGDGGGTLPPPPNMVSSLVSQTENPGNLSAAMVSALQGASANSGSLKFLYPYDQTVFPGGIQPPVLQWSQTGTPDGVYVHVSSQLFDYKGYFAGSSPTNLTLSTKAWQTAWAQGKGKSDPVTVEVATSTGGTIASATIQWYFARGSLAGDVYYNTYGSKLVPGQVGLNGAVMQIQNGADAPTPFLYTNTANGGCSNANLDPCTSPFGPCVSCHSLSANGSYMVAQEHKYPSTTALYGKGSMSFDLLTTPAPNPTTPLANSTTDDWGFAALYPDGTFLLTSGEPADTTTNPVFPGVPYDNPAMIGPKASTFYDTNTGAMSMPTGLDTPYAMMPDFSVDGKYLVYNNTPGVDGGAMAGHTLAIADFDATSKSFSNVRQIFSDSTLWPGWPFFTPDGNDIVFTLGNDNNYATEEPPGDCVLNKAYLYVIDVASGTSHRLDEAAGFNSAGTEYLPFPGRDEQLDFYPTVNPVASGGYFWVFFTSRRTYGNLYAGSATAAPQCAGAPGDPGTKSIWVTAIDIGAAAGTDPSHPAFYLPGQELGSGNIRAFPVLAPCAGDGMSCESGIDCCGGACTSGKCGVPVGCSMTNEKCTSAGDCCDKTEECIGGFCAEVAAQ